MKKNIISKNLREPAKSVDKNFADSGSNQFCGHINIINYSNGQLTTDN